MLPSNRRHEGTLEGDKRVAKMHTTVISVELQAMSNDKRRS